MATNAKTPRGSVYVGTYSKYNAGSLKGEWLDLDNYDSYAEFIDACKSLHADEDDPELMYQDWETKWTGEINEAGVSPALWGLPEDDYDTKYLWAAQQVTGEALASLIDRRAWEDVRVIPCDYEHEAAQAFLMDYRGIMEVNPKDKAVIALISAVDADRFYAGNNFDYSFVKGVGLVAVR